MVTPLQQTSSMATPLYPGPPMVTHLQPTNVMATPLYPGPPMVTHLQPTSPMATPLYPGPPMLTQTSPMATPLYPGPPMVTHLQPTSPMATPLYPGPPMLTQTSPMATPLYPGPRMVTPLQPTLGNMNSLRAPLQPSAAVLALPHAPAGTCPMMTIPTPGMVYQSPTVRMCPHIQMTPTKMTTPPSLGQAAFQSSFIPGNQMTYSQLPSSTQFASNPMLPSQVATPHAQVMALPPASTITPALSNPTLVQPSHTVALPQFSALSPRQY